MRKIHVIFRQCGLSLINDFNDFVDHACLRSSRHG